MHLPNGTLLQGGKYKIVRFIASGGFGCTYEAVHTILGLKYAIKEYFPKSYCNRDSNTSKIIVGVTQTPLVDRLKKKFIGEACAIAGMSHPGIVSVRDAFEENGTAYYVMDYIEGKSLAQIIKEKGRLSEKKTLGYIRQVCDALDCVHSKNRLHLDVKPGNVMVDGSGRAILIDFGASKYYDEETGEETSTLLGIYTKGYAPLEQVSRNFKTFNAATDIYALGATMYKCLTGETPLDAALLAQGEELKPLPSSISEPTRKAVYAAMEGWRKDRPQNVKDFLNILNEKSKAEWELVDEQYLTPEEIEIIQNIDIVERTYKNKGSESFEETFLVMRFTLKSGKTKCGYLSTKSKLEVGDKVDPHSVKMLFYERDGVEMKEPRFDGKVIVDEKLVILEKPKKTLTKDSISEGGKLKKETFSFTGTINGHGYVDLGLPSGLKWAATNIGASTPEEYGDYFAWGEIKPKSTYTEENSETFKKGGWAQRKFNGENSWLKSKGYIHSNLNLTLTHDAASQNWGASWRIPTRKEIEELVENTSSEWIILNGVTGRLLRSKINGNSIFLPAAGYQYGSSLKTNETNGNYWASTADESNSLDAYSLSAAFNNFGLDWGRRYYGRTIRPVSE